MTFECRLAGDGDLAWEEYCACYMEDAACAYVSEMLAEEPRELSQNESFTVEVRVRANGIVEKCVVYVKMSVTRIA